MIHKYFMKFYSNTDVNFELRQYYRKKVSVKAKSATVSG